ncbi:MAG TPA: hypothetical protein VFR86_08745, partial [Burkholderiaceae bacterium]|nr:hypothetical protein [Burkholderiaceae bacterium]
RVVAEERAVGGIDFFRQEPERIGVAAQQWPCPREQCGKAGGPMRCDAGTVPPLLVFRLQMRWSSTEGEP